MNQIKEPLDIIGKTITKVTHLNLDDEKLVIEFEEDSFFVIKSVNLYDYSELSFDSALAPFEQLEIGQITQEEYNQDQLKARAENTEWQQKQERQQYEKLKAIYGDKNEK